MITTAEEVEKIVESIIASKWTDWTLFTDVLVKEYTRCLLISDVLDELNRKDKEKPIAQEQFIVCGGIGARKLQLLTRERAIRYFESYEKSLKKFGPCGDYVELKIVTPPSKEETVIKSKQIFL